MSVATVLERIVRRSPTDNAITKLIASLRQPTLENLSFALRHPDVWPAGFEWNFMVCEDCAMGLAQAVWKLPAVEDGEDSYAYHHLMMETFSLSSEVTVDLFFKTPCVGHLPTPDDVANAIDAYLAANR